MEIPQHMMQLTAGRREERFQLYVLFLLLFFFFRHVPMLKLLLENGADLYAINNVSAFMVENNCQCNGRVTKFQCIQVRNLPH